MLDIKELSVKYRGSETFAVDDASFTVDKGSFTGLIGESGSGKSTIINAILGLLPAGTSVRGEIAFNGRSMSALSENEMRAVRWKEIALVPQGAMNSFTPVLTIGRHIAEVTAVHLREHGEDAAKRIDKLLEDVGLERSVKDRYPHELSGGQKQRAAIALALACSPSLLLADEPTTALDVVTQAGILKLLGELNRNMGLTIFLVTHDLPAAAVSCRRLIVMHSGRIVEDGSSEDVVRRPKSEYTARLVSAVRVRAM